LKRFVVLLTILILLTASVAGFAGYCGVTSKSCKSEGEPSRSCAKQAGSHCSDQSSRSVRPCQGQKRSCASASACQPDTGKCAGKQGCQSKLCPLLTRQVADGPSRARLHAPGNTLASAVILSTISIASSWGSIPQSDHPPSGIPRSISSRVLRI
jgi:hypothetical protein